MKLLEETEAINEKQHEKFLAIVKRALGDSVDPIKTAVPPKVSTVAPDKADSYYAENTWDQLQALNGHEPSYPYNKVNESESGHVIEIDDTPGYERLNTAHTSGTYEEIYNDGTRQVKIVGNDYEVFLNDKNIHIKGNMNMTVDGDLRQLVYGNYHLEVEKDYTIKARELKLMLLIDVQSFQFQHHHR